MNDRPFFMSMIERLKAIAAREIPITDKDCRIKRMHKEDKRKVLISAMVAELGRLSEQQKELKIKQWEDE